MSGHEPRSPHALAPCRSLVGSAVRPRPVDHGRSALRLDEWKRIIDVPSTGTSQGLGEPGGGPHQDSQHNEPLTDDDDPSARDDFAVLVRTMTPELLSYCGRRLDHDLAEEVVASAFEVVWRRWASLPPDDSGRRAWVYEATKRIIQAERRRHTRRARLISTLGPMATAAAPTTADEVLAREHVELALTRLPPDQAAVVHCVVLQDLSAQQTAQRLGISTTAVTSRLNRARPALRRLLTTWKEGGHAE